MCVCACITVCVQMCFCFNILMWAYAKHAFVCVGGNDSLNAENKWTDGFVRSCVSCTGNIKRLHR